MPVLVRVRVRASVCVRTVSASARVHLRVRMRARVHVHVSSADTPDSMTELRRELGSCWQPNIHETSHMHAAAGNSVVHRANMLPPARYSTVIRTCIMLYTYLHYAHLFHKDYTRKVVL